MEVRAATLSDWPLLQKFYSVAYNTGHPLHNLQFWQWQFGNPAFGQAFVGIANGEITGHLGVTLRDGIAWNINLYILPQFRNTGLFLSLIEAIKPFGRQININANTAAVKLYRLLRWHQYTDLIRMTCIRPGLENSTIDDLLIPTNVDITGFTSPQGHYWQQPGLISMVLDDGSEAVIQNNAGALRFARFVNPKKAVEQAWALGFNWVDYITSFNNPVLLKLERQGWRQDTESGIPWYLNPVVKSRLSHVTFFAEEPIPIDFYVNRTHSDIGRVGSLPI